LKNAMLQTPESRSPTNSTPFASSSARAAATSSTRSAIPCAALVGNSTPWSLRLPERERHVPGLELGRLLRVLRELEHVAVERDRPVDVPRRDVHEINSFDPQCRER